MEKSVFKSHELYYNEYINYPFNSLTSLFFLLPIFKTTNNIEIINYIILTFSSLCWWGTSKIQFKYCDLLFVTNTLFLILNKILNLNIYLTLSIYCMFILLSLFKYDRILKITIVIIIFLILTTMSQYIFSRSLFIFSLLFKISDTYCGFKYGTALFHVFSAISIFLFLLSK